MYKPRKFYLFLLATLLLAAFSSDKKKMIKVWLVGDSTCANKSVAAYPEAGWGMPFTWFFDSTVQVVNKALNGRSTKSFMAENHWQPIVDQLQSGDYVFIQFGHNDEGVEKVGRYTTPAEFKANLVKYVTDTRSKGAQPVLISPVARRKFINGELQDSHPGYSEAVAEVAGAQGVPFIDLDTKSKNLLREWGEDKSKLLYLHLEPGEHPNHPQGKTDNTHFSELGARRMAQIVLASIKDLHLELASRIVQPDKK